MSNFDFKSIVKLTMFDLKNNKLKILGWSIAIFCILFLYMILFPSVKDIAKVKMDAMPKEILQFMGMNNMADMGNFITYFGIIFNLILIAISIFATTFSANLICKEEKSKSIEFLNALNVSRIEIYFSKFITAFLGVLCVICFATISSTLCGFINGGNTFVFSDFIQIIKVSSFTAFFFISVAFLLAGITTKAGIPMLASMVVLLSYLIGYLGVLLGDKAE